VPDVPGPSFYSGGYNPNGNPSGAQVQWWDRNGGQKQNWVQQDNDDGSWSYPGFFSRGVSV
jgi:hypothetical protein